MTKRKPTRGVIYIVWGKYDKALLNRSIASVQEQGYKLEVVVCFDELEGLQKKSRMYDLSPYDITLFLDADTVVHGNLDYGFEMAEKYSLACCIAPASSAYHAGPNSKELQDKMHRDTPQLNTGVVFFSKFDSKEIFEKWKELVSEHPESAKNDQITFSCAVYEQMNPFILPRTWNFRKGIRYESQVTHGPILITHSKRP